MCKLVSTLKKYTAQAGNGWSNIHPKCTQVRKKPPPPPQKNFYAYYTHLLDIHMYLYCVNIWETERERESVCVCVCVHVYVTVCFLCVYACIFKCECMMVLMWMISVSTLAFPLCVLTDWTTKHEYRHPVSVQLRRLVGRRKGRNQNVCRHCSHWAWQESYRQWVLATAYRHPRFNIRRCMPCSIRNSSVEWNAWQSLFCFFGETGPIWPHHIFLKWISK